MSITKKKILVVDDSEDIRDMLKQFFESEGYLVSTEPDGLKGSDALQRDLPDLVISDLLLPGMHGLDFIKKIKDDFFIPVIIVSGVYEKDQINNFIENNYVEACLFKPIDLNQLKQIVAGIFNEKSV